MATIVSFGSFMLFVMNQHNANIINIKNSRSPRLKLTYSRETDQTMPAEGGRVEELDRCNSKQKKYLQIYLFLLLYFLLTPICSSVEAVPMEETSSWVSR